MKKTLAAPLVAATALVFAGAFESCGLGNGGGEGDAAEGTALIIEGVGLKTPESVLYDRSADVYLVSNVSGGSGDVDGDAFISMISPEGEVIDLKWIDSASDDVTLNAPKGMGIFGDELFVADIDTLRIFNRQSGVPIENVLIEGASFINDVAVDGGGNVFVSDSAENAIYKVAIDRTYEKIAEGDALASPNGVAVAGGSVWVASWDSPKVYRLDSQGSPTDELETPTAELDGLIILENGDFIVSSWEGGALYRAVAQGAFELLFSDLDEPADLGFDSSRNRVLIPLFKSDKIIVKQLP
jgi:hypothetical protein